MSLDLELINGSSACCVTLRSLIAEHTTRDKIILIMVIKYFLIIMHLSQ